ncbi:hypothetical protein IFU20_22310 [Pseudomonas viridiflava]|uniref:hypothetical protein n=1 Tax=Pseudomonas viridiflava TaxID=33069 RepID=UPI00177E4E5B|nr:hypothetical protein [Pseudomonas viridiflava]MBD8188915.1 hypothetical protein [Pseudomonas viridiflava]
MHKDSADEELNEEVEFAQELSAGLQRIYRENAKFREGSKLLGETIKNLRTMFQCAGVGQTILKLNTVARSAQLYYSKLYPEMIENLGFFANLSWFVSLNIPISNFRSQVMCLPNDLSDSEKTEYADQKFLEFYESWFDSLCSIAIRKFPDRAFALEPAFNAHKRGEFALSIPVFLSQSDGILFDLTKKELFSSNGHISSVVMTMINGDLKVGSMTQAVWTPLAEIRPIGWSLKTRSKNSYQGFNRNTIMHGLDNSYATEINSFKSFSLLSYIISLRSLSEYGGKPDVY